MKTVVYVCDQFIYKKNFNVIISPSKMSLYVSLLIELHSGFDVQSGSDR